MNLDRFALTTDQGQSWKGLLYLSGPVIFSLEPGLERTVFWSVWFLLMAWLSWMTRGIDAETGEGVQPDLPSDEEDLDLTQSLQDALAQGRRFAGMPLSLISQKLPVGISQKGIDLIKEFEGFRAKAYLCPARVWTIGYGHTAGVKPGMTVTKAQAEAMLRADLKIFERLTAQALGGNKTTQGQWDALVSFCYNAGPGNLAKSSMLRLHKAVQYKAAADAFLKWTKGGGRVLPGLVRRRQAERRLYLS